MDHNVRLPKAPSMLVLVLMAILRHDLSRCDLAREVSSHSSLFLDRMCQSTSCIPVVIFPLAVSLAPEPSCPINTSEKGDGGGRYILPPMLIAKYTLVTLAYSVLQERLTCLH